MMTLYFNHSTNVFTLAAGPDCEKVLEEWSLGDNKDHTANFEVGDFSVQVESHESWPGEQWKFLAAQVAIKGVKLLPYSLASIKGGYDVLTQIRIAQNNGKRNTKYSPVTLIERGCGRDWHLFLYDLCSVLNHYEQWQIEEFRKYFSHLEEKNRCYFWIISEAIDLVRPYLDIVPELRKYAIPFIRRHAAIALRDLGDFIANCAPLSDIDKEHKTKVGNNLWSFIKKYQLNIG